MIQCVLVMFAVTALLHLLELLLALISNHIPSNTQKFLITFRFSRGHHQFDFQLFTHYYLHRGLVENRITMLFHY